MSVAKGEQIYENPHYARFSNFFLNPKYSWFSFLLTVLSLFFSQLYTVILPFKYDFIFDIINGIIFAIFFVEMVALIIIRQDYFLKFEFFVDLMCLLLLIMDFTIITTAIHGKYARSSYQISANQMDYINVYFRNVTILTDIKIFRLIRLVNLKTNRTNGKENTDKNRYTIDMLLTDQFSFRLVLLFCLLYAIGPYYDHYFT